MPPVLSSQQHNGLMASMYGERNEVKRFRSHLTCTCKCDITTSASSEYFWLIDWFLGLFILWCVRLCAPAWTVTTQKMCMRVYVFSCTLQDRRATPLSSQLWPTYSYTHSADPTSVHAACSGHCGSTHLLPHTHTKWATAGLSSLCTQPAAHSPWWSLKFQPTQYSHT